MLLQVFVLLVVSGLGLYAIRVYRLHRSSAAPLVGTWKGEGIGNVLNIRPDGTARWRSSLPGQGIGYYEWTLDANKLVIYPYPYSSRNSVEAWFSRAQRITVGETPTECYDVLKTSPKRFQLRTDIGAVLTFTTTQESELEAVP
jgi:hypothetical protein